MVDVKAGRLCTTTVQRHPPCSGKIMFLNPDFLNRLLCHHVPSRKQDLAYPRISPSLLGYDHLVLLELTAVVTLCVSSGRRANLVWYLGSYLG